MRIFAWEYVTAGGAGESEAPASLVAEGRMMLGALVRDLARIPGVEVVIARGPGIRLGASAAAAIRPVDPADPWRSWRDMIRECDAVWPIAPETGGVLARATELANAEGRPVLNSRTDAVAIAASKLATARHLATAGIPVVPTERLGAPPPDDGQGWVVKPDDGAGCEATSVVADRHDLEAWASAGTFVVQPYLPGAPLSFSMLAQGGSGWLLSCNLQRVTRERHRLRYHGSLVGGAEHRRAAIEPLAEAIAAALPGLWGHVGVDLIDGVGGPLVVDVNPRLTTSYAGLAESLGENPAAWVLGLRDRDLGLLRRPLAPRAVEVRVPT